MLDWKSFCLAYLRSRSRVFAYIFSLGCLVLLFQFLFASLGTYFLYFFLLSSFVTFLFLAWDIFAEAQVYRQEILYAERDPKSPLERPQHEQQQVEEDQNRPI